MAQTTAHYHACGVLPIGTSLTMDSGLVHRDRIVGLAPVQLYLPASKAVGRSNVCQHTLSVQD